MTSKIDGQALFEKFSQQEPVPDVAHDMIVFICENIGDVLADVLDTPFTLASFSQAKLLYLKWMLENPAFNKKFGKMLDKMSMSMWRSLYRQLIGQLQTIVDNPEAFQKKTGMTDQVLINKMSLNSEAQALLTAGKLTIGTLLMAQAKIILDNTGE